MDQKIIAYGAAVVGMLIAILLLSDDKKEPEPELEKLEDVKIESEKTEKTD
jgi:hypothetical protein